MPFYVGKGVGRRAWSDDRHILWYRYVNQHLSGKYSVVILEDDLTPEMAEERESAWIAQESMTLVNWENMGRETDFEAVNQYHQMRNSALALFARARVMERVDLGQAISLYFNALDKISEYASIQPERGLIGQLLDEDRAEHGISGELQVLDRLTLCLIRAGRAAEAKHVADNYFNAYRRDKALASAKTILKRISKVVPQ